MFCFSPKTAAQSNCGPAKLAFALANVVAEGQRRKVYTIIGDPSLLIKIAKSPNDAGEFSSFRRAIYAIKLYYRRTVPIRRELREYQRVRAEGEGTRRHLQELVGTIDTRFGRGLVVRALLLRDGRLAPTLREMVALKQIDRSVVGALREFLDWFVASRLVAADVHLGNILFDECSMRIVLVDGIGDKTFIPLRAWSSTLNRAYKRRLARRIYRTVSSSCAEYGHP
jgi:hypothetical protein